MTDHSHPGDELRTSNPRRDVALGVVASFALISMLFAPLWVINLLLVALGGWLAVWAARTDGNRLVNERGLPRLWVFGLGGAGIAAHLTTLRFMEKAGTGRAALTISLVLIVVAMVIALARAARRFPD